MYASSRNVYEECLKFMENTEALPRVLGILGEGLFIFRDLVKKGHLFSGIWRESIHFGGFREHGAEEKYFRELGRKVIFLSGSREQRPPPPPLGASTLCNLRKVISNCQEREIILNALMTGFSYHLDNL